MSKETGGPAFPAHENWRIDSGMTLRDYFAAAALQGHIASGTTCEMFVRAKIAYQLADEMLIARNK